MNNTAAIMNKGMSHLLEKPGAFETEILFQIYCASLLITPNGERTICTPKCR